MTKIYKVKDKDMLGIIKIPAKKHQMQVARKVSDGIIQNVIEEYSSLATVLLEDGTLRACMEDELEEVGEVEDAGTTSEA